MTDIQRIAPELTLGADGIWYSQSRQEVSYPSDGNEACFQVEELSFWFKHRNACIVAAVTAFPPNDLGPVFDIGGGNGYVSLGLIHAGFDVVLVEPGRAGAANARKRGVPTVICASTATAGFAATTLGAVGLFDVIEHIEDDAQFLKSIRSLVKLGGRLYATVPTYSALWSREDELAGHFRRYTCNSICRAVEQAGFRIDYATYIFRPLPLPILLLRALPHRLGRGSSSSDARDTASDHQPGTGIASRALRWLLGGEAGNIASKRRMACGSSCLIVASAT